MDNDQRAELLPSQRARDAAADLQEQLNGADGLGRDPGKYRDGSRDNHHLVQAFTRFEQQITAALTPDRGLREAAQFLLWQFDHGGPVADSLEAWGALRAALASQPAASDGEGVVQAILDKLHNELPYATEACALVRAAAKEFGAALSTPSQPAVHIGREEEKGLEERRRAGHLALYMPPPKDCADDKVWQQACVAIAEAIMFGPKVK